MTSTRPSGRACHAVIVGVLFAGALVGCAQSGADTSSTGARPAAAAAAAGPSPTAPASTRAPTGTTGGTGGTGGTGAGSAATPGAAATGPAAASTGLPVSGLPSVAPSPVFLGEACIPDLDVEPAVAVNGLLLYCVPAPEPKVAGAQVGGAGRWSPETPSQSAQAGPQPGSECDPDDVGKIVQGAGGRPVSCLRESDGGMRWADVS
ncbi:hypothetical protein [Parafrankia sp. EUN1f]|uniref:hypothetical protein n=1 Tax=Parafrankia sp. EUN1f TaxID=102897 RepID=UPI0001C45EDE|nr:hypothetical protein [Parafrankia sp. EUN1f]EFC81887.1 conserved hypothetical protein [Parafrankia sp. EUN1f]